METETESSFKRAFKHIIEVFEGKYSNDADDPGGETYKGISRKMNENFEGWKIIDRYKEQKNYPNILEGDKKLQELVDGFLWIKGEGKGKTFLERLNILGFPETTVWALVLEVQAEIIPYNTQISWFLAFQMNSSFLYLLLTCIYEQNKL